jgi:glycerophosphoryl diester phosphodiesterase
MTHAPFPRIIGHRGAARLAPENTLASIRAAAAAGAPWVEVDSKLAADDVPVLFHDSTLDRTTDRTGPLVALSSAELAHVDAGSRFTEKPDRRAESGSFEGEPVPTLAQLLAEVRRLEIGLDLEIKPDEGRAEETALRSLDILLKAGFTGEDALIVTSFAPDALAAFQARAPRIPRGLLITKDWDDWLEQARALDCFAVIPNHKMLETEADVRRILDAGLTAMTYTVNDPDRAALLLGWGVSSVVTDDPIAMAHLI